MSRIFLWAFLLPLLTSCTGIREIFESDSSSDPAAGVTPALRKKIAIGSTAVATLDGFVALGCADSANFNFCFTVMSKDGEPLSQAGDLPKITVPSGGHVTATSIAFLPPSDVVIAGHTSVSLGEEHGGNGDGFVARYSLKTGSRLWIRQFGLNTRGKNSNQKEEFHDVAIDSGGTIHVAGRTRSNLGGVNSGNYDALLVILSAAGEPLHVKQVGSAQDDDFYRVVLTADDNVVVAGHTCGNLVGTNAVNTGDASYNPANPCPNDKSMDLVFGSWQWDGSTLTQNFLVQLGQGILPSGAGALSDFVYGLAASNSGDIYFTGGSASRFAKSTDTALASELNGGQTDLHVGKLGPSGTLQWIRSFGKSLSGSGKVDFGRSILVQENGSSVDLLVCGETLGNLFESQGGGAVLPALSSNGKGDVVLLKLTEGGVLTEAVQYGNSTAGSARSASKEGCGRILRKGNEVVLFGTSSGKIFSTGSGSSFIARDQISNFTDLLKE